MHDVEFCLEIEHGGSFVDNPQLEKIADPVSNHS